MKWSLSPSAVSYPRLRAMFTGLALALVLIGAYQIAQAAASKPFKNWDMLAYIGAVHSLSTNDPKEIRARALEDVQPYVPPKRFQRFAQKNRLSKTPEAFAQQLPFYTVKPLYVGLMTFLHGIGVPLVIAMQTISILSVMMIVALGTCWKPANMSHGVWWVLWAGLMGSGQLLLLPLAKFSTPDALAVLLIAAAAYTLFAGGRLKATMVLMALAVAARPDMLLPGVIMIAAYEMAKQENLRNRNVYKKIALLTLPLLALYWIIGYMSGYYGWSMQFIYTFHHRFPHPAGMEANMSWDLYWPPVKRGLAKTAANPAWQLLAALSVAACAVGWKLTRGYVGLLAAMWAALVLRIFVYPNMEPRYFAAYKLLMIISIAQILGGALRQSKTTCITIGGKP